MRRLASICAVLALAAAAEPASAHGPCDPGCLTKYAGFPGERVQVHVKSIRAVLNPRRSQIPYGPRALWTARVRDVGARTLYRSSAARRHSFRVPRVPPGRYVIAIFDGSEGGSHYTWTHFRVRAAPS